MAKIDDQTAARIKSAAKIEDVFSDAGIELHRRGASLLGLCPFHNDNHLGSFTVNPRRNIFKCFSCGAKGDPVQFVMDYYHKDYPEALRYLAAMYNIYIDDTPAPKVEKREPRKPMPPTTMAFWPIEIVKPYLHHYDENPLLKWMLGQPMIDEHKARLRKMIEIYCVGTSLKGKTIGWTVFPQIDTDLRVRDIKLMAYMDDGHRVKDRYSFNWMHSMMEKAGTLNPDTHHVDHCLFGLHLAKIFPKAEVCIVESEKSAVICSAFSDPNEKIWMATGGKSGLNPTMMDYLLSAERDIVLYPDYDGYGEWMEKAEALQNGHLSVSPKVAQLHIAADGDKCDIADIMIRLMHGIEETEADKACRLLGLPDTHEGIAALIDKLDLAIV